MNVLLQYTSLLSIVYPLLERQDPSIETDRTGTEETRLSHTRTTNIFAATAPIRVSESAVKSN